ncbi:MAG: T9SS type A sorting domain-containing protein [Flavobacteriales bacterium]
MKKIANLFICIFLFAPMHAQTLQWMGIVTGSQDERIQQIASDPAGNYYTAGDFEGTADFDPGPGSTLLSASGTIDISVQKFDPAGNLVYARSVGGTATESALGIAADASGNAYVTGYFQSATDFDPGPAVLSITPVGVLDAFLMKLDPAGDLLWAFGLGSTDFENGRSVRVDASGNVLLVGYFNGTVDFDPGPGTVALTSTGGNEVFACKYDPNGALLWAKRMGGSGTLTPRSCELDYAGNIIIAGEMSGTGDLDPGAGTFNLTSAGSTDAFVVKLDPSGAFLWAGKIGGVSTDACYSICSDATGQLYLTGFFSSTADLDPGTGSYNMTSAGSEDIFLCKLSDAGAFVWAVGLGAGGSDVGYAVDMDLNGHVRSAGVFFGSVDMDPGIGSVILDNPFADYDVFLLHLDPDGTFMDAGRIGGSGEDAALCLHVSDAGNLFLGGFFEDTVDIDPGPSTVNVNAIGGREAFILRFGDTSVGIEEQPSAPYALHPNPASDRLTIQGLSGSTATPYTVYDLLGRTCDHGSISAATPNIDIAVLPSGTYMLCIGSAPLQTLRVVKE